MSKTALLSTLCAVDLKQRWWFRAEFAADVLPALQPSANLFDSTTVSSRIRSDSSPIPPVTLLTHIATTR